MKLMSLIRIATVMLAIIAGCRRSGKELVNTNEIRSVEAVDTFEGRARTHEGMPSSWYRSGAFKYADRECFFEPPHPPPGTRSRYEFECGVVAVGLASGLRAEHVADVLSTVAGIILRDNSGGPFPSLMIRVPPRTERSAVLRLLDDPRIRYASFNWMKLGTQG
jgi:hypothetical protein